MTLRPAIPSGRPSIEADGRAAFAVDVQYYLSQDPKQLPSRYLYDALGSCLFEAICLMPWYPIARAETRLLTAHRREIFGAVPSLERIVELGGGNGEKLATLVAGRGAHRTTLDVHLIDVSSTALALSMRALGKFERVRVVVHEGSYEAGLSSIRHTRAAAGPTLMLFLGSNIGNFDPPGAEEFLRDIRAALAPGDFFLLGADLVKPEPVIQLAYDDPLGITAAFNRNLLVRINRELDGDFDLSSFAHLARWNESESRVEMHLVSLKRQVVRIDLAALEITLDQGESIWTESSYKYDPDALGTMIERAGFERAAQWIDAVDRFALTLVEAI